MIEVHNLTFGYSSTEDGQILKGVDFAAKNGKLTDLGKGFHTLYIVTQNKESYLTYLYIIR